MRHCLRGPNLALFSVLLIGPCAALAKAWQAQSNAIG